MGAALGLLGRAAPKGARSPLSHPIAVPGDTHHVTQVVHGQLEGVDAQRVLQVVGVDVLEVLLPDQPPCHLVRLHGGVRWRWAEGAFPRPPPPPPWGHRCHGDVTRVVPSSPQQSPGGWSPPAGLCRTSPLYCLRWVFFQRSHWASSSRSGCSWATTTGTSRASSVGHHILGNGDRD